MAKLKVGVIGVGGIAKLHMPGWEQSPHTEVIAGADVSEKHLRAWQAAWHIDDGYTRPEDLINRPDIDIIDICTPNGYHTELTIAALEAGKHVMCEKPLAPTPGEIQRMIEARDRSGKMLMTAQHFRFGENVRVLKREVEAGKLGDIYHARSWMLRRAGIPIRPGFLLKKQSHGGACIDIGVHILDLTMWFMGNPIPVTVSGVTRTELAKRDGAFSIWSHDPIMPEMDVEEFASAFIRFDNGATLILEVSWLLHHNTGGKTEDMQMWLYGSEGGAHWPGNTLHDSDYTRHQMYDHTLLLTDNINEPHAQECIEFAQAILDDAPSPVPAEQSLQVMRILDGVYQSAAQGREVVL
ncbi:MAG: gfo/Idh/MocA family oxidoreductase [Chloroflexi bacterium]|nr:MAG: gfo/Idh/MocA family oxidoreductase [Chloroflexota bacterium]